MHIKFYKNGELIDHIKTDRDGYIDCIHNNECDVVFAYGFLHDLRIIDVRDKTTGITTRYSFDNNSRLDSIHDWSTDSTLEYEYDSDNNIVTLVGSGNYKSLTRIMRFIDQMDGLTAVVQDSHHYMILDDDRVVEYGKLEAWDLDKVESAQFECHKWSDGMYFYDGITHAMVWMGDFPRMYIINHHRNRVYDSMDIICIETPAEGSMDQVPYSFNRNLGSFSYELTLKLKCCKPIGIKLPYISTSPITHGFYGNNNVLNMVYKYFGRTIDADRIIVGD